MVDDGSNDEGSTNSDYLADKQVESPATIGELGKRQWLYPDRRPGPRADRRRIVAIALIIFYFVTPWITIADRPVLRVDVISQSAHLFGLVLKLNEYNLVFFLFAALALILFLVTALRGRIWCGYACPQTVFIDWVFRPIEEWLEGSSHKRRRLDAGPMTPARAWNKILKHVIYLALAAIVANAFLGFFVDPRTILSWVTSPPSEHPTAFGFVLFITGLTYFDLAWFREQFCSFLCPYARFQSAMLDDASPSVTYDSKRAEPRGKGSTSGDCIDCKLCVRVCPTGIDIRDGLQLECIQCERCIDACDSVMGKLRRPINLIGIFSQTRLRGEKPIPFYKRARVLIYSALIAAIFGVGAFRVGNRDSVTVTILRTSGAAFSKMDDGRYSNLFNVRAINHTDLGEAMKLKIVSETSGIEMICPSCNVEIEAFGEQSSPLIIIFDKNFKGSHIQVQSESGATIHTLPIVSPW